MNIVFDLDGTLANCRHRLHHIQRFDDRKPDWDAFYAAAEDDVSIEPVAEAFRDLSMSRVNRLEIWTGRPERLREATLRWLFARQIYPGPLHFVDPTLGAGLRMRPDGDHQPDWKLKAHWLDLTRDHSKWWPDLVFEDRNRVVEMYRSRDIVVAQVAEGKF